MDSDKESKKNEYLIKKRVLSLGKRYVPYQDGSKITFHFQTWLCGKEKKLLDDSRKIGKKEPMVLVLGKKFKMEVWEVIIQKMSVGEVAQIYVDKSLVYEYPFVSKTLRDLSKNPSERRTHSCSMTLQNEGVGYEDLNALIRKPTDLEFIIEILKVESPNEYEKENWQMNDKEANEAIPRLREKGNNFFKQKKYAEAITAYGDAIELCEQLMLKEKPKDEEWVKLDKMKIPLLLNYAQCKLIEKDYYAVIVHCTSVLQSDPKNVKALYRRGLARGQTWQLREAYEDLRLAVELRPSLASDVQKILDDLGKQEKEKKEVEKSKLAGMFR